MKESETENKKIINKKVIIAILSLLIIALISILTFICLNKDTSTNNDKRDEQIQEYKIPSDETELTDKNIIADINKKIEYLNTSNYNEEDINNEVREYDGWDFRGYLFKEVLDDTDKLHIVLNLLDDEFEKMPYDIMKTNINRFNKFCESIFDVPCGDATIAQLSTSSLTSLYTNLFGEEPKEYKDVDHYCPTYLYDNINNMYFRITACAGTRGGDYLLYKDKMTYKDDEIYVYAYYGMSAIDGNNTVDIDDDMFILYKDLDFQDVFQRNINDREDIIDIFKKNYKSFTLYKYTFKKDITNNYYFKSLEKLS